MGKKIAGLAVGVVLVAALITVTVLLMQHQTPDAASSSLPESESVYLIEKDENSLSDILVQNKHGHFKIARLGDGFGIPELAAYDKNEDHYNEIVQFASSLAASREVESAPDNLKKYGLEPAQATAHMTYTDGDALTLYIGDPSASGDGYYVRTSEREGVYILSEAKTVRFLDDKLSFIGLELTSTDDLETETTVDENGEETEKTITPDIKNFTIYRKDLPTPIDFIPAREHSSDEQLAELECPYALDSPFNATLSSDNGSEPVDSFYGIMADRVVALNPTEAQLKSYGLDDPTMRVVMQAKQQKYSHVLTAGKGIYCKEKNPEAGHTHEIVSYYVTIDGGNVVYEVDRDTLLWMDLKVEDVLSEYVVNPVMNEVKSVNITVNGKKYEFSITGKKTGSDATEAKDTTKVTYRGQTLNVEKFRNFYVFLNAITADALVEGDPPTADPVMRIEYVYRSKKQDKDVVELVPYKNSTMAVVLNGDASLVTRAAFVDRAIENIERVITNKEINTTW